MKLRIGIDFDNTIVCYDRLFHRVAFEQGLIPADLPMSKGAVRDYLRAADKEDAWTAMQGEVYGKRMSEAQAFVGVLDWMASLIRRQIPVFIVSHKTRHPYAGPPYDLHTAAMSWLAEQGVFDCARIALPREHVYFELTKKAKLNRVACLQCTHFIDDLPEILNDPDFPDDVQRLLFDPNRVYPDVTSYRRLESWAHFSCESVAA